MTETKQYEKDYCPECGAKYATKIADWTCPVCETEHPGRPSPQPEIKIGREVIGNHVRFERNYDGEWVVRVPDKWWGNNE